MNKTCQIRITRYDYDRVISHLFPGDHDEHGAVLLAGMSQIDGQITLQIREVHLARERVDYVEGEIGYRALAPSFIHRIITRARDQRLVYLAIHNHECDLTVNFSAIDFQSHRRGYPALLQIARGMPVGALVFGRRSIQADLWLPDGNQLSLDKAVVVGTSIQELTPSPQKKDQSDIESYDRQIRMFGSTGQQRLSDCKVAVIGLGGIGSLVSQQLAHLGVGRFVLVDSDQVEASNLSRIVGATRADASESNEKVAVAKRVILSANPDALVQTISDDMAKETVASVLKSCDYLFLAADSMRARLVTNAIVHQYLIPGVQLGSKIRADESGTLQDVMSANRPLRPGLSCLWCSHFIDMNQLAIESKSDEDRKQQVYGVGEPNPSVISLNAISAAHAVNDFMLDYLGLREEQEQIYFEHIHHLRQKFDRVEPRKDSACTECSRTQIRYGRGDGVDLPCIDG